MYVSLYIQYTYIGLIFDFVFLNSVPGTKYISLSGANSGFVTIEERTNPIGLLQSWKMGPMERNYDYDHTGRLKVGDKIT